MCAWDTNQLRKAVVISEGGRNSKFARRIHLPSYRSLVAQGNPLRTTCTYHIDWPHFHIRTHTPRTPHTPHTLHTSWQLALSNYFTSLARKESRPLNHMMFLTEAGAKEIRGMEGVGGGAHAKRDSLDELKED